MLLVTLMTLTQETRLSAVPDRPACYPTRAAPICRDALLGSLINTAIRCPSGYLQIVLLGPVSEPQNQNRSGCFLGVEDGTAKVPS
jgi:hypothetical protein